MTEKASQIAYPGGLVVAATLVVMHQMRPNDGDPFRKHTAISISRPSLTHLTTPRYINLASRLIGSTSVVVSRQIASDVSNS